MDSRTRILYWLLSASRGGPTRTQLLGILRKKPMNLRRLSLELSLDYKTVQGHVEILVENGIIYTPKKGYGSVYFISPELEQNEYLRELLGRGGKNGKKTKKTKKSKR